MTPHRKKNLLLALKRSLENCLHRMKTLQEIEGWKQLERSERISKILQHIDHHHPLSVSAEFLALTEECQILQAQLDQWLQERKQEIQSEWISTEIQRKLNRYLFDGTVL